MLRQLQVALLLALTLGLCLTSPSMATRLCTVSLDSCSEAAVPVDDHCETDCCGEESDCCLAVLSNEAVMISPGGLAALEVPELPLDFISASIPEADIVPVEFFSIPDPPPLTARDFLAQFEIRLI